MGIGARGQAFREMGQGMEDAPFDEEEEETPVPEDPAETIRYLNAQKSYLLKIDAPILQAGRQDLPL